MFIIQETKQWLVVNKAAGMIVERNPFEAVTVESLVYDYLSKQYRNPYVGIVHRLDKVTSGALIVAKRKSALRAFNELFRQRQIQKHYLAIVENEPPKPKETLTHWLVKDQKNKRAIAHLEKVEVSFECRLEYELLEKLAQGYLLQVKPETGKFHQIRVQLSAIGCPILGDEKYGAYFDFHNQAIALHAHRLIFQNPNTKEMENIEADLPNDNFWKGIATDKLA